MDAQFLNTRGFIETYKLMRSRKGVHNSDPSLGNSQMPEKQVPQLQFDVVLPQAKNTFLTTYDPLESL